MAELSRREFLILGPFLLAGSAIALFTWLDDTKKSYIDLLFDSIKKLRIEGDFNTPAIDSVTRSRIVETIIEQDTSSVKIRVGDIAGEIHYNPRDFSPPTQKQLEVAANFIKKHHMQFFSGRSEPKEIAMYVVNVQIPPNKEDYNFFLHWIYTVPIAIGKHTSYINLAAEKVGEAQIPGKGFWTEFAQTFRGEGESLSQEDWANEFGIAFAAVIQELKYDDYFKSSQVRTHSENQNYLDPIIGSVPSGVVALTPYSEEKYQELLNSLGK